MRFLLPASLLLALLGAGCSTPMEKFNKRLAKKERAERTDNSRTVEQRRMMEAENGRAGSQRGAEILIPDKYKEFDPSRNAVGGRTYDAGKARTKDFYYDQKTKPATYSARDFNGSKTAWAGDLKYRAKDADMRGKYAIPNAAKAADTKTAATKEAWDANKVSATRGLHDGQREYLGPESKKLRKSPDAATMADWRNAGETVTDTGRTIEKYSTMKQLTVDDVRELLNKNK